MKKQILPFVYILSFGLLAFIAMNSGMLFMKSAPGNNRASLGGVLSDFISGPSDESYPLGSLQEVLQLWDSYQPLRLQKSFTVSFKGEDGLNYLVLFQHTRMEIRCISKPEKNLTLSFDPTGLQWSVTDANRAMMVFRAAKNEQGVPDLRISATKEFSERHDLGNIDQNELLPWLLRQQNILQSEAVQLSER